MHHIIQNETSGMLDMSPLKDTSGLVITLRPAGATGSTREIDDETVNSDIVQRVLRPKWVSIRPVGMHTAAPVAVVPEVSKPIEAIVEEAKTFDTDPAPVEAVEPALVAEPMPEPMPEPEVVPMPVETVETSETPMTTQTSKKTRK